jgi:hypothetical protein
MSTKVVKKGTNRAGHAARTSRAAQRTPLPPKGGAGVERTSVDALRDEVAKRKVKPKPKPAKAPVVNTASKPAPAPRNKAQNGRRDIAADVAEFGAKVVELRAQGVTWLHIAHALGRSSNPVQENQKTISVWAQRLYQLHTGNAPDNKPTAKTARTPEDSTPRGTLPWDSDISEAELLAQVTERKLVWRRRMDGGLEEDHVRGKRPIERTVQGKVVVVGYTQGPWLTENDAHEEILNFHGEGGTRSVHLDSILQVH